EDIYLLEGKHTIRQDPGYPGTHFDYRREVWTDGGKKRHEPTESRPGFARQRHHTAACTAIRRGRISVERSTETHRRLGPRLPHQVLSPGHISERCPRDLGERSATRGWHAA